MKHILIFFISISFTSSFSVMAQEENTAVTDTITKNEKYGLRVGADISKPIRSFFEDDYTGFEIMADFRVTKKFYAAIELGNETKDRFEENLNSSTNGSYAKIGFNFNSYNNWLGMNNEISAGMRYGFSTFKQELLGYTIYTGDDTFPTTFIENPIEYKGLTAHWAEIIMSIKTEIFNNLYLSLNVQLKRKISEDKPENFKNLFIPGFNRTYDFSEFGVGYGYTLSYLIPIFKK
ncbi:DUF6048 family protein [Candidatus Marifrigoribacter sp. Uisw_064]|uniref:DUF6048 family protein n=1 Tax=Candidatus Marifrigoribacter sp. Uisw_064 TaxID=3230970 RepID=UPI003D54478E